MSDRPFCPCGDPECVGCDDAPRPALARCPYGRTRPDGTCRDGTPGCRCADEAVDASLPPAPGLDYEKAVLAAANTGLYTDPEFVAEQIRDEHVRHDTFGFLAALNAQHAALLAAAREEEREKVATLLRAVRELVKRERTLEDAAQKRAVDGGMDILLVNPELVEVERLLTGFPETE